MKRFLSYIGFLFAAFSSIILLDRIFILFGISAGLQLKNLFSYSLIIGTLYFFLDEACDRLGGN